MLFLIGITILTNDFKRIHLNNELIENSNLLLNKINFITNNCRNIERITLFMNIKEKSLKDLLDLIQNNIFINNINETDYDFEDILRLFYKFDFRNEYYEKLLLRNILKILYKIYNKNSLTDLNNNFYKELFLKIYFKVYKGFDFLSVTQRHIVFLLENIKKLNYKFKLFFKDKDFNKTLLNFISNNIYKIEKLKIEIYQKDSKILENLIINVNRLKNLEKIFLIIYQPIDLIPIKKYENLKHLEIHFQYFNEFITFPEIKNLESLKIKYFGSCEINFGKMEKLKILAYCGYDNFPIPSDLFKYCPNLEYLFINTEYFNLDTNLRILKDSYYKLKHLKAIHIFDRYINISQIENKQIENEYPKIIIHDVFFCMNCCALFLGNNNMTVNKKGNSINESMFFIKDFDISDINFLTEEYNLENINEYSNVNYLSLMNLNVNQKMVLNFKKFKYINTFIIENVRFEVNSFFSLIDSFKFNIKSLELHNIIFPENEIKILRKLKFLENLTIRISGFNEEFIFYNLFLNISQDEFLRLKYLELFSNNFNENDLIFREIKNRGVFLKNNI